MNKQNSSARRTAIFMSLVFISITCFSQSSDSGWNKRKIAKWYNKGEWLNGCQLKAHPSVNTKAFAEVYFTNKIAWDKTFEWLKNTDLNSLEPGRYTIDEGGNSTATVSEAPAPALENVKWEAHKNFNDIQYIVKGEARMGSVHLSQATATEPFDDKRDIGFYSADGVLHDADPGTFFIFTPQDVHRPGIKADGYDEPVKKIVIKIKVVRSN